jgi:hypothetical protein
MSSPPRSLAQVRPMRAGAGSHDLRRARSGQLVSVTDGPSARFFARVHLPGLLHDGRSHVCVGTDIARGVGGGTPDLADALGTLRTGRKTGARLATVRAACAALTFEQLHAEFLERVAALGDLGLPPLLLARRIAGDALAPVHVEPAVAIRLLAGTAGGVFVRARAPSAEHFLSGLPGAQVPWAAAFDYYLPVAP